jgi:putative DNA primase/helicase
VSLHPKHVEDLQRSGLSETTIELMGVRSVPPREIDEITESGCPRVESVLEFPYPTVRGFSRYKLFPPQGDMKYFQKKKSTNHLYVLPPVAEILGDVRERLYFVEGEKKTACAVQQGLRAVGFSGIWNWKTKENWKGIDELQVIPLPDREIEIVPDSDTWERDDLQRAIYAFGKYLESRGAKVSIVLIPQAGINKVGLDDFFLGSNLEQFQKLRRLSLKHLTLAQHKDWYERWKEKSEEADGDGLQGKPLFLREIEPHSEIVDGAELLCELCRAIRHYIVAENADIVAIAAWCIYAHAIDAFSISPFLNLSSPEKGCGKSTTLTVLSYLLPRPLLSANVSPASIFRTIELHKPSFLIDEADSFENLNEELRGLLNASHLRASAQAIRVVGDNHEPRTFSTWCPKAISLIGRLPPTLDDRSLVIVMRRRKQGELCERFSAIDPHPELELLGRKIARWVKDRFEQLKQARPIADGIYLRVYDNWMPLLAIADLAGGKWPDWVRIAARQFVAKAAEPTSIKVELLIDMSEAMNTQDRIASEDLVKALNDMSDRPWPTWKRGKPITQIQVSRMIKDFEIKPMNIRNGDKVVKGYYRDDILAALSRYAPPTEPLQPLQEKQDNEVKQLEAIFVALRSATEIETNSTPPAMCQTGHDKDRFDWVNGTPQKAVNNENIDKVWSKIRAEHAAKRSLNQ